MLRFTFIALFAGLVAAVASAGGFYWWIAPQLPSTEAIRDVRLQTPLKVYSGDGLLIGEFGEKRRIPVRFDDVPETMIQAFLAAEDDRFFHHLGVDWAAILRAAWELLQTGEKNRGGSTITMQVARNYYLTLDKTYTRKLQEIVLSLKLEREFSKKEILEMYLNQIFLGQRAYGVASAAQVYYGKSLAELTLAEIATIAAIPKAPSAINPVSNPERARERRGYVLGRMLHLGYITREPYDEAMAAPVATKLHGLREELEAPYVAEMVRQFMQERFGDSSQTDGYRVYTTLSGKHQAAANGALRMALNEYDLRHGYRGAEKHVELPATADQGLWEHVLAEIPVYGSLEPALVVAVEERAVAIYSLRQGATRIEWDGLQWARAFIDQDRRGSTPTGADQILRVGDVVRIQPMEPSTASADVAAADTAAVNWRLTQIPAVEGALVSMSPNDGAILALVGGFDFNKNSFNRVIQASRQPGSSFKPFIYSAALERGFTPASFINDAPIVMDTPGQADPWRPLNFGGRNYGPTRVREALYRSRNVVSIRLLQELGIEQALAHVALFGFDTDRLPHSPSLALGSGELAPIEVASGYAVFANGGYRIEPYFVARVERDDGTLVHRANPAVVCPDCDTAERLYGEDGEPLDIAALKELEERDDAPRIAERVVDETNVWIMNSMLRDVVRLGTATKAKVLKRNDLHGKTGTTNDQKDAWFSGFNQDIVTTVWMGFDQSQPLGALETGAVAALPMWIDYMQVALEGVPDRVREQPPGVVTVRINPNTGFIADGNDPEAIFEVFRADNVPTRHDRGSEGPTTTQTPSSSYERLF